MITPADGFVPEGMPENLDRVHAALGAPGEPAPEALLERILASRAAGERVIVPVARAQRSIRSRLVRAAIAATVGLVAFSALWRWMDSRRDAIPTNRQTPRFAMLDALGLGVPVEAQGAPQVAPRFEPMTYDTTRVHPVTLRYEWRRGVAGEPLSRDTLTYSVARSTQLGRPWVAATIRVESDDSGRAAVTIADTTLIDPASLRTLAYVYAGRTAAGEAGTARLEFGSRQMRLHVDERDRDPRGTTTSQIDTAYTLPETKYPLLVSFTTAELFVRLMAAPLAAEWKKSVLAVTWSSVGGAPGATVAAADFEVVGEEQVRSPAETVAAWRIVRRRGTTEYIYRVRKLDGVVLSQIVEGEFNGRKFRSEFVLINEP